jgi:enoyl-CoA hydratase/carnithine racemase
MALVECEKYGSTLVIRMNRPEKMNAMNAEMLIELGAAFSSFRDNKEEKVAVLTGTGAAFCAGEDLVEAAERGTPGLDPRVPWDPFWNGGSGPDGEIDKPIIAAVNGWAMGGGFLQSWMCDFRIAVKDAIFEISEARHWLLGAYKYAFTDSLPWAIATELALGFRITGQRAYDLGFVNRVVDSQDDLIPEALHMCDHLAELPPASVKNTLEIARALRPRIPADIETRGVELKSTGNLDDVMEARRAFAEKRKPRFTRV